MGTSFHDHSGLRTIGNRITQANTARQKAIAGPPYSCSRHRSKSGAFAKNPLLLHKIAARSTSSLACHTVFAEVSGCDMVAAYQFSFKSQSALRTPQNALVSYERPSPPRFRPSP